MLGESNARVVTGLDHNAPQQIFDQYLGALTDVHLRAALAPCLHAAQDFDTKRAAPARNLARRDVARHDLREACRRQPLTAGMLNDRLAGVRIDQKKSRCGQLRLRRNNNWLG